MLVTMLSTPSQQKEKCKRLWMWTWTWLWMHPMARKGLISMPWRKRTQWPTTTTLLPMESRNQKKKKKCHHLMGTMPTWTRKPPN
jgi:hypothetical protein